MRWCPWCALTSSAGILRLNVEGIVHLVHLALPPFNPSPGPSRLTATNFPCMRFSHNISFKRTKCYPFPKLVLVFLVHLWFIASHQPFGSSIGSSVILSSHSFSPPPRDLLCVVLLFFFVLNECVFWCARRFRTPLQATSYLGQRLLRLPRTSCRPGAAKPEALLPCGASVSAKLASLRHFFACNAMPTRFGITWRTSARSS